MNAHTSANKMMKMTCTMMCMCCGLFMQKGKKI